MKVLMVCLGNICRSPLAEGILRQKIEEKGLSWSVDSAGTSGWHNGELPDSRSIDVARLHSVDITDQRSRKFVVSDFEEFDLIVAMDSSNYSNIIQMAKSEDEKSKVKLLLNFSNPGENQAVPDPYYSGGFEYVYTLIETAIDDMIEYYQ